MQTINFKLLHEGTFHIFKKFFGTLQILQRYTGNSFFKHFSVKKTCFINIFCLTHFFTQKSESVLRNGKKVSSTE